MSTSNNPLWVKMIEADKKELFGNERAAAALRVIADEVVPEEPEPEAPDFPDANEMAPWQRWHQRRHTRQRLLAEAERAEAGR